MNRRSLLAMAAAGVASPVLARPQESGELEVQYLTYGTSSSAESLSGLKPGQMLSIAFDPGRESSSGPVALCDETGRTIGHLPPRSSGAVAALLEAGWTGKAEVLEAPSGRRVELSATLTPLAGP